MMSRRPGTSKPAIVPRVRSRPPRDPSGRFPRGLYCPPFWTYDRTNSSAFSSSTSSISSRIASTSSASFSWRSLTSSLACALLSSASSPRRVVCRWPPVSFVAMPETSVVLGAHPLKGILACGQRAQSCHRAPVSGERVSGPWLSLAGPWLSLAGQRRDQLGGGPGPVDQVAHVGAGAPQRLQRRHPLQRVVARDVEDHRVPGGRGHRIRVFLQAAAPEI